MKKIELKGKTILVTGAAGFIGAHLVMRLLKEEEARIVGIDDLNDYYDVELKKHRLELVADTAEKTSSAWIFEEASISDRDGLRKIFDTYDPAVVVNLAAQAGVRYSISHPDPYIETNINGFYYILEECRRSKTEGRGFEYLVYASSSSVYGDNSEIPYKVEDPVDKPVSLYAATKKSNELMAHAYSKLYGLPVCGLRFFTVYGPAGRPDMAYFGFTDKLIAGKTIDIFNYGNCKRDFTYVDDVTKGVSLVIKKAPEESEAGPAYALYNIGNSSPVDLMEFIEILGEELIKAGVLPEDFDMKAHERLLPMQPGDVPVTYADTSALQRDYGYSPSTDLRKGLSEFAGWYKRYYCK
ncbi:MAG: NAD-dependent epimerase/dehydratase family protein [Lachnospiraceae bacterium]|nr:NAD-dependent epimerase/dehydratase family protein [Lachnospiraceae bacterium]